MLYEAIRQWYRIALRTQQLLLTVFNLGDWSAPFEMASIRSYVQDLSGGTFAIGAPTTAVEDITGAPSESFETIARKVHRPARFDRARAPRRNELGAYAFMIEMMLTRAPDLDR